MDFVEQNSYGLAYASEEIHDDKEIALKANNDDVCGFVWASEKLQDDKGFVTELKKKNNECWGYALKRLRTDRNVTAECPKLEGLILVDITEEENCRVFCKK